jgi:hypothetical protein
MGILRKLFGRSKYDYRYDFDVVSVCQARKVAITSVHNSPNQQKPRTIDQYQRPSNPHTRHML